MVRKVAICGAGGTMGAGIALVAARAGFLTVCYDTHREALDRARLRTSEFLANSVSRGKLTIDQKDQILSRLVDTTDLADLADADLVIEAVFEDLDAKKALFGSLDTVCKAETIFASNTSTLSITELAEGSRRADRIVGMHFCLPAQLMALMELSRGINTSDATFAAAWQWSVDAAQTPVETQDKPGFILNALLVPFNNDVIRAVEAGVASPADIDKAIKRSLGYKMGPCELLDLVGLDTQVRLCEAFYKITSDPRAAAPPLLRRMVAAGHLGRKTGRGFYPYAAAGARS